jgi:hypothetical protein
MTHQDWWCGDIGQRPKLCQMMGSLAFAPRRNRSTTERAHARRRPSARGLVQTVRTPDQSRRRRGALGAELGVVELSVAPHSLRDTIAASKMTYALSKCHGVKRDPARAWHSEERGNTHAYAPTILVPNKARRRVGTSRGAPARPASKAKRVLPALLKIG